MYNMKEIHGGCSVCCDTGSTENPLLFCDDPNCDVVVHQACYGIRTEPKGKWFCRKCETLGDKSNKVKCELCPSNGGALKPTKNDTWVHVVCALYIPEVTFENDITMEPVILSAIPRDCFAFNKRCYMCEEKSNDLETTYGACISCNKSGCKLGFHVTCAQGAGLLCEEEGKCYADVKYVGYCKQHYSNLKKSDYIRPMTRYPTQNQPVNLTSEKRPHQYSSNFQTLKRKSTSVVNFGKKMANEIKVNDLTIQSSPRGNKIKSRSYVGTTHPSENSIISNGIEVKNKSSTNKKQYSESEIKQTSKYRKTKHAVNIPKAVENDRTSKVTEKSRSPQTEIIDLTQSPDPIICSPSINNQVPVIKATYSEKFENSTNAYHMLENLLNPLSSMSQKLTGTLNKEIKTHKLFDNHSNSSACAQKNVMDVQIQRQNPSQNQPEISLPQSSAFAWSSSNGINNDAGALEDLLERNWDQSGAFLMEQAQYFDVASLLTCLHQLKSETANLENELSDITRRRDHLLTVYAQRVAPLIPQNNRNRELAPPTININYPEAHVPIQSSWSNYQNNFDSIESPSEHGYQIHQISNRHPTHIFPNNVPSQAVSGGCVNQEPRLIDCREVNQHLGASNSNFLYSALTTMTLPCHQMSMNGQPKHS